MSSKRPLETDDGSAKRASLPPSKCLHVRNIPLDCATDEIMTLFVPFGQVTRIVKMTDKPQAIIEFADISSAEMAMRYFENMQGYIQGRPFYLNYSRHETIAKSNDNGTADSGDLPPNSILLIKITNPIPQITVDTLFQVFSIYGRVLKIVIFVKSDFRALVQYDNIPSATNAIYNLNGRDIYSGCCTLTIGYSKLSAVTVKGQTPHTRDYTVDEGHMPMSMPMGFGGPMNPYGFGPSGPASGAGSSSGHHDAGVPNSVVLVTGLAEGITPDHLFKLFGFYGNINRIKILFNKKDHALIQFTNSQGANSAMTYLNDCVVRGRPIKVHTSKHTSIAMPREQDQHSELTKDFSESKKNRYHQVNSKALNFICAPTATLHISNIPPSLDEEELKMRFTEVGFVKGFQFLPGQKKMALIQMDSPEQAINGLIQYHDMDFDGHNLRVSFTRSQVNPSNLTNA